MAALPDDPLPDLPLDAAAEAVGLSARQLGLRIRGAPDVVVTKRGRRGRGGETRVSLPELRAWLQSTDRERAELAAPVIRRDSFAEALAVIDAVIGEMRLRNQLQTYDVKPWRAEQILGLVWSRLQAEVRARALRDGGLKLPEIDTQMSIKPPRV